MEHAGNSVVHNGHPEVHDEEISEEHLATAETFDFNAFPDIPTHSLEVAKALDIVEELYELPSARELHVEGQLRKAKSELERIHEAYRLLGEAPTTRDLEMRDQAYTALNASKEAHAQTLILLEQQKKAIEEITIGSKGERRQLESHIKKLKRMISQYPTTPITGKRERGESKFVKGERSTRKSLFEQAEYTAKIERHERSASTRLSTSGGIGANAPVPTSTGYHPHVDRAGNAKGNHGLSKLNTSGMKLRSTNRGIIGGRQSKNYGSSARDRENFYDHF